MGETKEKKQEKEKTKKQDLKKQWTKLLKNIKRLDNLQIKEK